MLRAAAAGRQQLSMSLGKIARKANIELRTSQGTTA
jgi:hypothetical protein